MHKDGVAAFTKLQNTLSREEIEIIEAVRSIERGEITVIKKKGKEVMLRIVRDVKLSKD